MEVFGEALASKNQTIAERTETIHYQKELIAELRRKAPQPVTLRQLIDVTWIGRMLGQRERRLAEPEGPAQRPLPRQEPA